MPAPRLGAARPPTAAAAAGGRAPSRPHFSHHLAPLVPQRAAAVACASGNGSSGEDAAAASSSGDGGWEAWADAPDTPRLPAAPPAPVAGALAGADAWRADLAGLADAIAGGRSPALEAAAAAAAAGAAPPRERAFLVAAALKSAQREGRAGAGYGVLESLEELGRLADTAGLEVVGHTHQLLDAPNARTYVGAGKVAEIAAAVERAGADTVVFDDELSPGQLRNLERALGGKARLADRTALILDIFSQRAASREGKLQVELAQTEYQLPRLTRMWTHMERQAGGNAGRTKGMGETQLEVDRRLLRGRAARLRRAIEDVRTHRRGYRARRAATPVPVVALVGYTNAGKSTLLNALTGAGVLAEDRLFATLDPTTRRAALPGGRAALFSDTVGFIQKLPTQLVAAFRATLEEVKEASLLVHVVDVSHPQAAAQVDAVNKVLAELGAANVPTLTAWNKLDACADGAAVRAVAARRDGTVAVSARTGEGLEELLAAAAARLADVMVRLTALVPYAQGELVEEAHRCGVVEACEFVGAGTLVRCRVPPALAARLRPLEVDAEWGVAEGGAAAVSEEEDYESWSDWEEAAEAEAEAEAAAAGGAERP